MSNSFMDDAFASFGFGGPAGSGSHRPGGPNGKQTGGLWDTLDQLRSAFEQRVSPRMGRGDVRTAVLALLAERPMHGYQIISEIAERSGGAWKPSPGSVYPTLQLLADEGLILAEESGGRKTYSLTPEGRDVAAESAGQSAPWESSSSSHHGMRSNALPRAGIELAQAAAQVGRSGSAEQVQEAVAVLEDARRKLYSILARD